MLFSWVSAVEADSASVVETGVVEAVVTGAASVVEAGGASVVSAVVSSVTSRTPLVGNPSAYERHEIDECQKSGIDLSRHGRVEPELGLKEQQEDCEHRIVAETFARIGQRQHIETRRLILKHNVY